MEVILHCGYCIYRFIFGTFGVSDCSIGFLDPKIIVLNTNSVIIIQLIIEISPKNQKCGNGKANMATTVTISIFAWPHI